ncbi:MAG: response regulator [Actinomycetes bacterium]
MTVTVVLADDEHLVRAGLATVLQADGRVEVVAEATDGREAVDAVRAHRPDVALLDVRMPTMTGIEAVRALAADPDRRTSLVVLTTFDDDELLAQALRAGALGYLLKSMPRAQLVAAVETAAQGDVLLAPAITARLLSRHATSAARAVDAARLLERLTPREREVLALVARGRSNEEIAGELYLAPATVKTHVSALLDKLGARDRVQLVVLAHENGIVTTER